MSPRALSAGHLRHRITIQTGGRTGDGRGGVTKAWTTHAAVWARVQPVSAREAFAAGQLQGAITHRITLRFTSGVTTAMRVSWGSRVLRVIGVRNPGEDDRLLELDCVEERV